MSPERSARRPSGHAATDPARGGGRGPGPQAVWLGHPVTVTATAVLIVNDQVLKRAWPGVVTGKLSDLAGMLVAPPLLALLAAIALSIAGRTSPRWGRPGDRTAAAAIAVTAVLFTWMKTTGAGAEAATRAWALLVPSSHVVPDPTDLAALPVLVVAWTVWRHAARHAVRARARLLVALPAAVFAVTATSAMPPPPAARAVEVRAGEILVAVDAGDYALASGDGGRSWHERKVSPHPTAATRACVPGDPRRCYRSSPGRLRIERTADGGASWTVAWEISRGRQIWLNRGYVNEDPLGMQPVPAASVAVAVQAVPGGHLVAAANGTDGVVLRDAAGRWRRLGFLDEYDPVGRTLSEAAATPLASPGLRIGDEFWVAFLVALTALLAALGTTAGARRRPVGFVLSAVMALAGVLLIVTAHGMEAFVRIVPALPLFALGTIGVLVVWLTARPQGSRLLFAAPAMFAAVYLPFLGWSAGWPDDYGVAVLLALLLGLAVLVAAVRVAVRTVPFRARRGGIGTGGSGGPAGGSGDTGGGSGGTAGGAGGAETAAPPA